MCPARVSELLDHLLFGARVRGRLDGPGGGDTAKVDRRGGVSQPVRSAATRGCWDQFGLCLVTTVFEAP